MNFKQRIQSDPVYKKKVIKALFLAIGAIGIIFLLTNQDNSKADGQTTIQNQEVTDDYFVANTENIIDDKNKIYGYDLNDQKNNSDISLGEIEGEKNQDNALVESYLQQRQTNQNQYRATPTRAYSPTPPVATYQRTTPDYELPQTSTPKEVQETITTIEQPQRQKTLEDILREKNNGNNAGAKGIIKVAIHNDQTISSSNSSVRLRLIEPLIINGKTIGTNHFLFGRASMGNNGINIYVENINYNNEIIPLDMWAYEHRTGNKGLHVSEENLVASVEKVGENRASGVLTKHGGVIGAAVKDIFSGRNKNQKIKLISETYLILRNE